MKLIQHCTDLAARWRTLMANRQCRMGAGTRILPGGGVLNPQRVKDAIIIGNWTWIAGQLLVFSHAGRIRIGDYCYVGENAKIWSAEQVCIGDRVFLAHGVNVHDGDSHSRSAMERHQHFREMAMFGAATFNETVNTRPVHIEDDVWIGFYSTLLKGVTIGKGAIVGASTVVTRDVAPFTVVAGNPAVVIGESKP